MPGGQLDKNLEAQREAWARKTNINIVSTQEILKAVKIPVKNPCETRMRKEEFPLRLSGLRTQLVSMRIRVQSLASLSGLRIWHCYGVGHGCGSDLKLLWLWHRPAAAAPIGSLAWEPPYAAGAKKPKEKKRFPQFLFV